MHNERFALLSNSTEEVQANLPYEPISPTLIIFFRQYWYVFLSYLASSRTYWTLQVILGIIAPLGLIFFTKTAIGIVTQSQAIFLLGGDMTMSILFGPSAFLIILISLANENKEFDFWMMLPVPKLAVVLAIITVSMIFATPGLICSYILGSLLLAVPFTGGWMLLPFIPLGVLALTGVGALLGGLAPNSQTANVFSNLMILSISFLSPMMIPSNAIPWPLRIISYAVPTTYVADAFRAILAGNTGMDVLVDAGLLSLFSIVLLMAAQWRLRWRRS